jgi:hypothetical protein
VLDTFWVVEYTKGIVTVSKLKVVFVAFDVNPAVKIFVVVIAFDTYKLFVRVMVVPTMFVVVSAFAEYTFKNDATFEPAMDP